jgi:hypothetical protein
MISHSKCLPRQKIYIANYSIAQVLFKNRDINLYTCFNSLQRNMI